MHIKVGLVGLPNVGKSSFFNALTGSFVQSENYPFCTINPNISRFITHDRIIDKLVEVDNPNNIVNPTIEVYDIAGLVKGASEGEGLGNLFLSHIREVDLIIHVVRFFNNSDIIHVENRIDPVSDIEIIKLELILKDIESINKRLQKLEKNVKSGNKDSISEYEMLKILNDKLGKGICVYDLMNDFNNEQIGFLKELQLLTAKPVIYVGNVDSNISEDDKNTFFEKSKINSNNVVFIPIKMGADLNDLSDSDKEIFENEISDWNNYLDDLTAKIYKKLGIITFYTSGKDEVRGWLINDGVLAPKASAEIHSDFEKHFIKVDVCNYLEYYNMKKEGKNPIFITCGKDYKIKDGDVVNFRVGV